MPDWADVYIPPNSERAKLEKRRLFFVLNAADRLFEAGVSQTDVGNASRNLKEDDSSAAVAGRNVIEHVFQGNPVSYGSAVGFLAAANAALDRKKASWHFTTRDIVACVFRLKDGPEILSALNVTHQEIAKATDIKPVIVEWAMHRWRISYVHAHEIWLYLLKVREDRKKDVGVLTADEADFIVADERKSLPMAVRTIDEEGHEICVYKAKDLLQAPPTGHKWAVS